MSLLLVWFPENARGTTCRHNSEKERKPRNE